MIALGGGSPMDAAKVIWLMYEVPDIRFDGLAMRFMDIRKRVYDIPETGHKAQLVRGPGLACGDGRMERMGPATLAGAAVCCILFLHAYISAPPRLPSPLPGVHPHYLGHRL